MLIIKLHVAINAPSSVLQTIVQYPGLIYVTRPFSSTVATDSSEDDPQSTYSQTGNQSVLLPPTSADRYCFPFPARNASAG